ncbi:MAG: TatD family hydrolase [Alphaproteobacteria bacterium]
MLVDSHCHLDFPEFAGEMDHVVRRAALAGVGMMLTICTRISEFERIRDVAGKFAHIYCSVGIHPHEADSEPAADCARIVSLTDNPKVIGVGETGLDYFYEHSSREAQQISFRAHISAARETGLPLIVHARDADADTIAILRDEAGKGAFPGVIHCFTAGPELARAALDLGLYISLSGIVTFKSARDLRETAKMIPSNRLLVETDAPFLAPMPHRGKRNEPAFVADTARYLAEFFGETREAFSDRTTDNFFTLFNKADRANART